MKKTKVETTRLRKMDKVNMRRGYLIVQMWQEGFFASEIGRLFRITEGRVFQILRGMATREKMSLEQLAAEDKAMSDFLAGRKAIKQQAKKITANFFRE